MATPATEQPKKDAVVHQPRTIKMLLEEKKDDLQKMLGPAIGAERFIRVALTTIADERIKDCTPASLYTSLLAAASVGLVPDGFLGHAYIVPFNNKVKLGDDGSGKPKFRWEKQAKMLLGYRGLIELALRSEKVLNVRANVVYANDKFEYEEGSVTRLEHKPVAPSKRGEMIGAYAVATVRDMRPEQSPFKFMWAEEILAIRERSKNAKDSEGNVHGPWATDPAAMWCKTVVRQLAKFLPLRPEELRAVVQDEYTELGITEEGAHIEVPTKQAVQPPKREAPKTVEAEVVKTNETPAAAEPAAESGDLICEHGNFPAECGDCQRDTTPQVQEPDATEPASAPEPSAAPKAPENIPGVTKGAPVADDHPIGESKIKLVWAQARRTKKSEDEVHAFIKAQFGVAHVKEVKNSQLNALLAFIKGKTAEREMF